MALSGSEAKYYTFASEITRGDIGIVPFDPRRDINRSMKWSTGSVDFGNDETGSTLSPDGR